MSSSDESDSGDASSDESVLVDSDEEDKKPPAKNTPPVPQLFFLSTENTAPHAVHPLPHDALEPKGASAFFHLIQKTFPK